MTRAGRSSVSSAFTCAALLVGCTNFDDKDTVYLNLPFSFDPGSCDGAFTEGPANGACRVAISLEFPYGTDADKLITLRADGGKLVTAQGTATGDLQVSVKTAHHGDYGVQTNVATLIAPLEPKLVRLSAELPGILAVANVTFARAPAAELRLSATTRTFRLNGTRFSDFTASVSRPVDSGRPSTGTEVSLSTCCPAIDADSDDCSRYMSVPSTVMTTAESPTALRFEGRLTAEGDDFLAQKVTQSESSSIYVLAGTAGAAIPACPAAEDAMAWLTTLGDFPTIDVVELRVTRDPLP